MVWSPFFPHVYPGVYGLARMVRGTFFHICLFDIGGLKLFGHYPYEKVSDVPETRVWFASKNLTPCWMH